jgi:hypothetical protein
VKLRFIIKKIKLNLLARLFSNGLTNLSNSISVIAAIYRERIFIVATDAIGTGTRGGESTGTAIRYKHSHDIVKDTGTPCKG